MASELSDFFSNQTKKFVKRCTMDSILKQARKSFETYLDPKIVPLEHRFSTHLLKSAEGIVFITEAKAGFLFGIKGGTGVIICKIANSSNEWSAPISVGTGGASFGFQAGISKIDHIIILQTRNQVKTFLGNGRLQIGGDASIGVAKYGRDANIGFGIGNNRAAPVLSYSFGVQGLYGGVSIDGTVLLPRNDCNKEFYGKEVSLTDIESGAIEAPSMNENYSRIIQLLVQYTDDNDFYSNVTKEGQKPLNAQPAEEIEHDEKDEPVVIQKEYAVINPAV